MVVITKICGGRGDIAAGAKVIQFLQNAIPSLYFNWFVQSEKYDLASFLMCKDPSKVAIWYPDKRPKEPVTADLIITGPIICTWPNSVIEEEFHVTINGPRFGFLEIAHTTKLGVFHRFRQVRKKLQMGASLLDRDWHKLILSSSSDRETEWLAMGLTQGTGIFIDETRLNAPRSRGYCCPNYLLELEDTELRDDLLQILGEIPDYSKYSFNSGYAHHPRSWKRFIDFTAAHEQEKHVVIVLNQHGELNRLTTEEFREKIFTKKRLAQLIKLGYGTVSLQGSQEMPFILQSSDDPKLSQAQCGHTSSLFTQ